MIKKILPFIACCFIILLVSLSSEASPPKLKQQAKVEDLGVKLSIAQVPELGQIAIDFKIPHNVVVYSNLHGKAGLPMEIAVADAVNLKSWTALFPASVMQPNNGVVAYVYDKDVRIILDLIAQDNTQPIELSVHIKYSACGKVCEIFEYKKRVVINTYRVAEGGNTETRDMVSLLWMILFSLLGGCILNLMPCVLPVLSIKIFGIINAPKLKTKELRMHMVATILGIVTSFLILAFTVLLLKHLGYVVGWGLHFQNPIFLSILVLIVIIFANNLWGRFEIQLPGALQNKIANLDLAPGLLSNFLTGILATILATPCTAPFLSTSVAFALSQDYFTIIAIYLCIGIGMAMPYIILVIFPKILHLLPRPGKWMLVIRKCLALILLLTAVWLLFVLSSHLGFKGISALIGMLIILQAIFVNPLKIHRYLKLVLIAMMLGMIIFLPQMIVQQEAKKMEAIEQYWIPFDRALLQKHIKAGAIIFVDVTADWCITCKFNKIFVLDQISLLEFLKQHNVILMKADYTTQSHEIAAFLRENKRYGIPFNIVYGPQLQTGIILPEILTRGSIVNAVLSL